LDTRERTFLKDELAKQGIVGEYLESWQPREDLYLHVPRLNNNGKETRPIGSVVPNQPSDMDHKYRLARRGVLPWPPTEACGCKGCRERDWSQFVTNEEGHVVEIETAAAPKVAVESIVVGHDDPPTIEITPLDVRIKCPDCDFVVKSDSKNPVGSLRFHRMGKHRETQVA